MKIKLLILQITFSFGMLGQADSSQITQFLNKERFPNVQGVEYRTKKFLWHTFSEGWIVSEKAGPNATILVIEGTDENEVMEHKMGVWRYYYGRKKIECIDSIKYENNLRFGSQTYYKRNGDLDCRYEVFFKSNVEELTILNKERELNSNMMKQSMYYEYNSQGKIVLKQLWEGEKLISEESFN